LRFSIVVPTYNDREYLELLLKSYSPPDEDFEFIVVDDCSSDDTSEMVKKYPVRYFRMEANSGPAAARNRGVRDASGDVIIFCDSDILLGGGALERVKWYFEEGGEAALMATGHLPPHNPGFFPKFKYYQEMVWDEGEGYTDHFNARFGATRKDFFLKVGGFDQTIRTASVEDYEFGHRLAGFARSRKCSDVFYSHRHPSFLKQAKLYFVRAGDYISLLRQKGSADNVAATSGEAAVAVTAFLSQAAFVLTPVSQCFAYIGFGAIMTYLILARSLFKLILAREGPLFALRSIMAHYVLCSFIVLGACWGVVKLGMGRLQN